MILGKDERKNLPSSSKAQKSPHSAACKVSCKGFCSWSCSGILIGRHHVLTSAHCIDDVNVATLQAGFLERNGRLQWYDVRKVYVPLRWKISKDDDYAVLKLSGLRNRRSFIPIALMSLPTGSMISITGKRRNVGYRSSTIALIPYWRNNGQFMDRPAGEAHKSTHKRGPKTDPQARPINTTLIFSNTGRTSQLNKLFIIMALIILLKN